MAKPPIPKDGTGKSVDAIQKVINDLGLPVDVGSVSTVLAIISFFSGSLFENRVLDKLGEISSKLDEIGKKVDEILSIVRDIDKIVARNMADNVRRDKVTSLKSEDRLFQATLANYSNVSPSSLAGTITAQHKDSIRQRSENILKLAYDLQDWGPGAVLALGQAYGTFLIAAQIAQPLNVDISFVRRDMLSAATRAHTILSAARYSLEEFCKTERDTLNSAGGGREIMHGYLPGPKGNPAFLDTNFYARVQGDVDTGFRADDNTKQESYFNQSNRPVLGAGFPTQPFNCEIVNSFDHVRGYVDFLNSRATELKRVEKQLEFAKTMEPAARVLMLTIAVPIESR